MALPSLPFRARFAVFSFSLLSGLLLYFFLFRKKERPRLFSWFNSTTWIKESFILSLIFASCALSFLLFSPKTGIRVSLSNLDEKEKRIQLDLPTFEILPDRYPWGFLSGKQSTLSCAATFFLRKPIHSLLFYVSYGAAEWTLDDVPIVKMKEDSIDRYYFKELDIAPGFHTLVCKTTDISPPPQIAAVTGLKEPLNGPFLEGNISFPSFLYNKQIPYFLFLASFLSLIPFINAFIQKFAPFIIRHRFIFLVFGFGVSLFLLLFIHNFFIRNANHYYEADEAAFGFMAERLLTGQCPPLFHYEQNYQGTLEAYPLAFLLSIFGSTALGLHSLPLLWEIGFIFLTIFTLWKYGGPNLSLLAFFILGVGGLHFHWIFSKTWFGYSFTLFSGALLWLIALRGLRFNRLSPGWAILFGLAAGASFYQLPISLPFILGAGFIPICIFGNLLWEKRDPSRSDGSSTKITFLKSLHQSGLLLSGLFFVISCAPYWFSPHAVKFIAAGRVLAPSRIADENPLVDRFFGECLSVFFGNRSSYNQIVDSPSTLFPAFPTFLFILSFLFFPFFSKFSFQGMSILKKWPFRASFFIFYFTTVFLVSYSPFGVWPWYAIPLYWALPILLFSFLYFIGKNSPGLSLFYFSIYFLSIASGFYTYSPWLHQPSSLSYQGHWTPPFFNNVKIIAEEKNIRFLLCDQGFDAMGADFGKDWVGECLLFDSGGYFISVDRNSRRAPDSAQELLNASRVGYLFHKNYYFSNASSKDTLSNYAPFYLSTFEKLFGPDYLNFERFDADPYVLFLPRNYDRGWEKRDWTLSSSNPSFLRAAVDHNLGLRGIGGEAYWSSERIPAEGCFLRFSFPNPKKIQNLLLFHGTKVSDRTQENKVYFILENGFKYEAGSLSYREEIRSSFMKVVYPVRVKEIEIRVFPTQDQSWWTIYEIWVY